MKANVLIGKYVCYGNEEGGFCWGKIVSCTSINTAKGLVDAFVLKDHMTCKGKGSLVIRHDNPTLLPTNNITEEDVVDSTGGLGDLDDETLFRASMGDVSSISLGLRNMEEAKSEVRITDMAASVLKDRMGIQ